MYSQVGGHKVPLSAGVVSQTIGVYCGAGGTLEVVLANDDISNTTTFTNTQAGQWLPISIKYFVSGPVGCVGISL